MATRTKVDGFPVVEAGAAVLGEIVSWDVTGLSVRYSQLCDALRDAGLDPQVARAMLPRNAFARAARKLVDQQILRRVGEDEQVIRFQLTREERAGDELVYSKDAVVTLHKETGVIESDDPAVQQKARDAFGEAMDRRTASDITAVVQRLFSDRKDPSRDLVPVRKQGGAYFVRKEAEAFLDQVGVVLERLGGELTRLPIAAGTGKAEKVIRESVADKIQGLVAELDEKVADFDPDPKKHNAQAVKAAAERVKLIRFKIESYGAYLGSEQEKLAAVLAAADDRLKAKVWAVQAEDFAGARA